MVIVAVTFFVKDGMMDEFMRLSSECIDETRKETGCIQYEMFKAIEDENKMFLFEKWQSRENLADHQKTSHFEKYVSGIGPLLSKDIDIKVFDMPEI